MDKMLFESVLRWQKDEVKLGLALKEDRGDVLYIGGNSHNMSRFCFLTSLEKKELLHSLKKIKSAGDSITSSVQNVARHYLIRAPTVCDTRKWLNEISCALKYCRLLAWKCQLGVSMTLTN